MENTMQCNRRKFIQSFSGLFMGVHLLSASRFPIDDQNTLHLWDAFTDEEKKSIASSSMAVDILNYPGQGFSCARTIIYCALHFLGKSDEIGHAASSFGGGLGRSDLCGLLTGGHMAIGVAAGMIHEGVTQRQRYAREVSNQFWDWWEPLAPIHCRELKPKYDQEGYSRMIQRVALKVEELIKPALSHSGE
ncbi:C_GCAxxG_C_C family protein [bacterium]|nr:C_GCAxxG_C_C family protein [bacterium]